MNHFNWVKALLLAGALTTATFSHTQGQVKDKLVKEGNTKFIRFQKSSVRLGKIEKSAGTSQVLKDYLPLSKNDEFRLLQDKAGSLQMRHQKFQQYSKGIKVEFATYSIHSKDGYITTINGDFAPVGDITVTPSLSEAQALQYAVKRGNKALSTKHLSKLPKGELVIVKDFYGDQTYKLAYKFLIPQTGDIYIDAHRGALLFKNSKIDSCFDKAHRDKGTHKHGKETYTKKSLTQGNAETLYYGTQTIETQAYEGEYRLFDETRGQGIHVKRANPEYNYVKDDFATDGYTNPAFSNGTEFIDNDNRWTTGEWNQNVSDKGALQALWACGKTYDYYKEIHQRNSLDGRGIQVRVLMDIPDVKVSNGSYNDRGVCLVFENSKDGNTSTTLDYVGHEFTHGITAFTAGLIYRNEPGALNEAFSDIFGTMVENWANVGEADWLLFEDNGDYLRNMQNPKEKGHPDTYLGENWTEEQEIDNGGVHTNSSVLNHWFYILSEGEEGINDNGDSYKVSGLGIKKAADIAYRTLTVYLSENSGYGEVREAGIQAVIDLYGEGSEEEKQVTNAFYAIGVGESFQNLTYPVPTLVFSEIGNNEVTVNWDALDGARSYQVRYRQKGESKWKWSVIKDVVTNSVVLRSLQPGFTYEIQVNARYSDTSFGKYSTVNTVTTTGEKVLTYCGIKGGGDDGDLVYLQKVSLGNESNMSEYDRGYKDYTQESLTSIQVGETVDISIESVLVNGPTYDRYNNFTFVVWIDYNQDGDFEDEGEYVFHKYDSDRTFETQGTITVPAHANLGPTRMRVLVSSHLAPVPCQPFIYFTGEVEDYTVTITKDVAATKAVEKEVRLYPNPNNKGVATVAIPGGDNIEVIITDANGKMVVEKAITAQGDMAKVSILQPGMYIVRIFGKDNTILETKKLFIR